MSRIRIAIFEEPASAEPVRIRLVQQGVPAEIHTETAWARLWFVSSRRAGVRLEVAAGQAERATQLLQQWAAQQDLLHDAVRCPECRSLRVDYPQFTEKSLFTNLVFGLLAELGLLEREYYCQDCHCMWSKPGKRSSRLRPHMAPDYFLEDIRPVLPAQTQVAVTQTSPARRRRRFRLRPRSDCPRLANRVRFRPHPRWRVGFVVLLGGVWLSAANSGPGELSAAPAPSDTVKFAWSRTRVVPASNRSPRPAKSPTYLQDVLPIFMGKCARCHNEQTEMLQNWLNYRAAVDDRWEIKRRVWDSAHGVYFKQPMPTGNSPESQAITDEERATIREWVESGAPYGVQPAFGAPRSKAERIDTGKRLFATICAACPQPNGLGLPARFPPLAGSDFLNADKHRAIKVVVNGLQGEITVNGQQFNNSMPKFPLSDDDIASALTYVYNSFGNSGKDVTPQEVSTVRAERDASPGQIQAAKAPEEKSPFE